MGLIKEARSFCTKCDKIIPASIIKKNNKIYLIKKCKHKKQDLLSPDSEVYLSLNEDYLNKEPCSGNCLGCDKKTEPSIIIIDITNRCNLNCSICFANSNRESKEPSFDRIKNMFSKYKNKTIYLMGGEPTLREDLFKIIKELKKKNKVWLVSNGLKLADYQYSYLLKKTKVDNVILQFDGFNDRIYRKLRGRNLLDKKLKTLENFKKLNMGTFLSVTLYPNLNLNQIKEIVDYSSKNKHINEIIIRQAAYFGRYKLPKKRMNYSLFKIIEKETNGKIKVEDFLTYHPFLRTLSKVFLSKKIVFSLPCNVQLHLLRLKNNWVPITRFIDFKKIDCILKGRNPLLNLLSNFISGKIIKERCFKLRLVLFKNFFSMLLFKRSTKDLLSLRIETFYDRDNIDLSNMCECPGAYILNDGSLIPFCMYNTIYRKSKC